MASGIDSPPHLRMDMCIPLLALGAYSTWALYNVPVLEDDFSDPVSGWLVKAGPHWSVGYDEGAYRIELRGPDTKSTFLIWREGALPNVAVEGDVLLRSGERSTSGAVIGFPVAGGVGYGFGIGDDSAGLFWFDEDGSTSLATADLPPNGLGHGCHEQDPRRVSGRTRRSPTHDVRQWHEAGGGN